MSPLESQVQCWLNIMCGWKFKITAKVSQKVVIHCKDKFEVIEEFPKFTPTCGYIRDHFSTLGFRVHLGIEGSPWTSYTMKLCPRVPPLVVRSISEKDRKT